jgi:hypothetical protein
VEDVLLSLTTAWSFADPVTLKSIGCRDGEDVMVVLRVLRAEAPLLWDGPGSRSLAEELFSSLALGRVPEEFAEAHIMALTGWDWATLQETPADVVEKTALYLAVSRARETGGVLEFPDGPSDGDGAET